MKKQKYFSFLLLVPIVLLLTYEAQAQVKMATKAQAEQFFKTTTCFIQYGKPFSMYNAYMKEAVAACWKITPYRIQGADDFEKLYQDPSLSFVLISEAVYTENKKQYTLDILNVVCGSKGKGLDDMPDMGSVPLCYANDDEEKYMYRLPALLRLMQYQAGLFKARDFKNPQELIDYHNTQTARIKEKELWLTSEQLETQINSAEKIKKYYPYKVVVTTSDAIEDAVEEGRDIVILHLVAPYEENETGKCFKFIIGAADGKVYYASHHNSRNTSENALLLSDVKTFSK